MTDIKDQNPQIHLIQPIIQLINQGDIHKAIDVVEGLLIEFSDSSLLFNIRGACYKANDNLEKALESFKKACAINPGFYEAFYNLGFIQKQLGQIEQSIESYQKAIDIKPAYPDAHNNLGNIFLQLRQY